MEATVTALLPQQRLDLAAYRAGGGYAAWVVAGADVSALRRRLDGTSLTGLGGAHFPFAAKLRAALATPGPRVLVVNAAEDEPGSRKDRTLLERNPHVVIEGALLAAAALDADEVHLYLSAGSETARASLAGAVSEVRADETIAALPTLLLHRAPEAYVAGEASAAIRFLEGGEAKPTSQPPYPTERGYLGRPTLVANCETLANLPRIMLGADGAITRLVTVSGDVAAPGVFEVDPVTSSFGDLIELAGGLAEGAGAVKAIQPGGPSSAYLPASAVEVPLTAAAIRAAGSTPGCLAVRVLGTGTCLVGDLADTARFFAEEQCGQCPGCRMKTQTYSKLTDAIRRGATGWDALDRFATVDEFVADLPRRCSLIDMPTAPVRSAIALFRDHFAAHLDGSGCRLCEPTP